MCRVCPGLHQLGVVVVTQQLEICFQLFLFFGRVEGTRKFIFSACHERRDPGAIPVHSPMVETHPCQISLILNLPIFLFFSTFLFF